MSKEQDPESMHFEDPFEGEKMPAASPTHPFSRLSVGYMFGARGFEDKVNSETPTIDTSVTKRPTP